MVVLIIKQRNYLLEDKIIILRFFLKSFYFFRILNLIDLLKSGNPITLL